MFSPTSPLCHSALPQSHVDFEISFFSIFLTGSIVWINTYPNYYINTSVTKQIVWRGCSVSVWGHSEVKEDMLHVFSKDSKCHFVWPGVSVDEKGCYWASVNDAETTTYLAAKPFCLFVASFVWFRCVRLEVLKLTKSTLKQKKQISLEGLSEIRTWNRILSWNCFDFRNFQSVC